MIIDDVNVKIDLKYEDNLYSNLKLFEVENLLANVKSNTTKLSSKEMIKIPNSTASFSDDEDKHIFHIYVYKTSMGSDKWILLMKDDKEGYALYKNPVTEKMQLAWYNKNLEKPLPPNEEKKLITCYVPKH